MPDEKERSSQESLELDKLNVAVADTSSTETALSLTEGVEKEELSEKPTDFTRRILGLFTNKFFFIFFVVGMVITSAFFFFQTLYKTPLESNEEKEAIQGRITYSVSAPVGFKYHITFKLLVPFKHADEKPILIEKLSKIRKELIGITKDPDISKSFREKDLKTIKATILSVVHRITDIPVTELELTDLVLE